MTRDEMRALIRQAANPDTAAEALTAIDAEVTSMFDTIEAGGNRTKDLEGQVAQLRDSNMRLFLRVTGEAPKDPEEKSDEDFLKEVEGKILENLGGGKNA